MDPKDGSHIRIKDIALKAGCSIGTVDRVIHDRGKVSDPVKKRILKIIKELDYKPNVNARVLASKRPLTLGILLPSYSHGEYWELPNLGINKAIERYSDQGYNINSIHLTYNNPDSFLDAGLKLLSHNVDGVIMSPATYKESIRLVRNYFQNNIPFILIDSDIKGIPSLSFIGKDPLQSGLTVAKLSHQITRHISGKKKIWIINLTKELNHLYPLLARESSFMSYFADKQLQDDYSMITFDVEDQGSQNKLDAYIKKLFSQGIPNAIYVTGSMGSKIARSIKKLNLEQQPLLIGHDLTKANEAGISDESIDFLIEEEAERQGYLAVESMIRSVIYKEKIEKKQIMNLLIYTKENLPSDPPLQE